MVELPERIAQVKQVDEALRGKVIVKAEAAHTPHGFAWYTGDPALYPQKLTGKRIEGARFEGGDMRLTAGDMEMLISAPMRYHPPGSKVPEKHQLLLGFDDGSHATCTVAMWGGMFLYPRGEEESGVPSGHTIVTKPTPLDDAFTLEYFKSLMPADGKKLSVKGLLATEQRIPGVGNGVIQDILFTAGLLPTHDAWALTEDEWERLYTATRDILRSMTDHGGRDTEKDLYGKSGGYRTILSRKTAEYPCPVCGGAIIRKAYLGGNVYYCPTCQK